MRNISIRVLGNKFMAQGESVYLSLVQCSTPSNGRLRLPAPLLLIFGFLESGDRATRTGSSGVSKKNSAVFVMRRRNYKR